MSKRIKMDTTDKNGNGENLSFITYQLATLKTAK